MSRVLFLNLDEADAATRCGNENVGISAIEALPEGGVRLVCMSVSGAETMREKLRTKIIKGDVTRSRFRPQRPLW